MSLRKCAPVVHVHYFPLSPSSRRVPSVSGSHAAALPAYRAPNCAKSTETSCGPIGAHPPGRACDRCPGPEMAERATTQEPTHFGGKSPKQVEGESTVRLEQRIFAGRRPFFQSSSNFCNFSLRCLAERARNFNCSLSQFGSAESRAARQRDPPSSSKR